MIRGLGRRHLLFQMAFAPSLDVSDVWQHTDTGFTFDDYSRDAIELFGYYLLEYRRNRPCTSRTGPLLRLEDASLFTFTFKERN